MSTGPHELIRERLEQMLAKREDALVTLQAGIQGLKELAAEQANDDGLWFVAQSAPEGYLQQELRRLHQLIEAMDP